MKKAILGGFLVIIFGIIVLVAAILYFPGPYILAASYPIVDDECPIYRTTPPSTESEIKRLGNLFNLSMNNTAIHNGIIEITDESRKPAARLSFFTNSGTYEYAIPEKVYPYTTEVPPDLPSDEEACKIALGYLTERRLLPDDVTVKEVTIGSQVGEYTPTSTVVYTLTKRVNFGKEIQGFPVYGANLAVTIGDKGEVVGVANSYREFDPIPVRPIRIISPEEAYRRLLSNDLVIKPIPAGYGPVVITNITLGYWMEIPPEEQEFILPVYAFSCVNDWGVGKEQVVLYVSAVDPSELPVLR
jgi:hypothetical protein